MKAGSAFTKLNINMMFTTLHTDFWFDLFYILSVLVFIQV